MKEDVLPEGWEYKSILSLIPKDGIISDGDWIESKDQDVNGDVRLIQLADIGDGEFKNKSRRYLTSEKAKELNCTYLKPNDILIARMPDPIGRACVFPEIGQKSVTAVDICIIRLGERPVILAELLVYWVNSSFIRNQMNSEATGTTRKRITRKKLEQFKIPLPPLPEQQYLSQKLTALLDEVAQTKQRLETIPALLKQFRQSVLADAVSGRLTEEWREENGKIFEYISGTVADLGIIITGNTPSKKNPENYINGFFPMFKPTDLDSGYYLNNGSDFLTDIGKKLARFIPKHSTLVTCIGATIGKTAFSRIDGTCNQQINAIIPNSLFNNKWIYFLMISPEMQNLIIESSSSTTLPILNKSKFSALPIIYPPKEEQTQIVQKVETYFALADEIETQVNVALENVNLLTQSILAKAFSGELSAAWRNSQVTETQGNV